MSVSFQVRYPDREALPAGGSDSVCCGVPAAAYVQVDDGPPALNMRWFNAFLRRLAESQAKNLGKKVHHAEFWISRDYPFVADKILHVDDCGDCRAAALRAGEFLEQHPDKELLVGVVYWVGE